MISVSASRGHDLSNSFVYVSCFLPQAFNKTVFIQSQIATFTHRHDSHPSAPCYCVRKIPQTTAFLAEGLLTFQRLIGGQYWNSASDWALEKIAGRTESLESAHYLAGVTVLALNSPCKTYNWSC